MTATTRWDIVTCEFPPDVGGVSDYASTMALALASAGCDVHVWCSGSAPRESAGRVRIHVVPDAFTPGGLRRMGRELDASGARRRLFVQWVPHGYGYRSLNLWFALWLAARRYLRGDELHILVHEPFLAFSSAPRRFAAALVHRIMIALACRGAARVWMSTPSWAPMLRPYVPARLTPEWLPIPAVGGVGDGTAPVDGTSPQRRHAVVGHFSAHSPMVTALLGPALEQVLRESDVEVLLLGRDSDTFLPAWLAGHPWAAGRIHATGTLPADELRARIAACDVMLQPYPDGVSTRRTSVLAMFANGAAVVTNSGALTEPLWAAEAGLELVHAPDATQLAQATVRLVRDAERRRALAESARELYNRLFHVSRGVERLLASCAA